MAQEADYISNVADQLRDARCQQKLSIEAVAKEICVRACYLRAIEECRYNDLPGKTFVVGFVKSYAKMLKLDPQALSEQFKSEYDAFCVQQSGVENTKTESVGSSFGRARATNEYNVKMVAPEKRQWPTWLSPVVGLVGAGMSWFLVGANYTVSNVATIDQMVEERTLAELTSAPAIDAPVLLASESADAPLAATESGSVKLVPENVAVPSYSEPSYSAASIFLPAAHAANHVPTGVQSNEITLQAVEDSWIQLFYRDGTEMWSGILRSGQSYRPQLIGEVFLTTSNAGGIILKRSDASLGPLGDRGGVIEALALDSSIFGAESFSDAGFSGPAVGGSD